MTRDADLPTGLLVQMMGYFLGRKWEGPFPRGGAESASVGAKL